MLIFTIFAAALLPLSLSLFDTMLRQAAVSLSLLLPASAMLFRFSLRHYLFIASFSLFAAMPLMRFFAYCRFSPLFITLPFSIFRCFRLSFHADDIAIAFALIFFFSSLLR